jgi:hypothetical protein
MSVPRDVLVDTNPPVVLHMRDDPQHASAGQWLCGGDAPLHTVEPALAKTPFFVPARQRAALAGLAVDRVLAVHHPDATDNASMAELMLKHPDLNPVWADITLIWLAGSSGLDRVATVASTDFGTYRIHGRRHFELAWLAALWQEATR